MVNDISIIDQLAELVAKLRQEQAEAQRHLAEIDEKLRAVETTMRLFRTNGALAASDMSTSLVSELKGKTHLQALITIAYKNNACFKVVDAKRLMLQAGLLRSPKNALSMLYTIISRSGKFEKVAPGEYRLIESQESLIKPS